MDAIMKVLKKKRKKVNSPVTGVYSHLAGAHRASGEAVAVSLHILLSEAIIPPLRQNLAARSGAASRHVETALRAVHAHDCEQRRRFNAKLSSDQSSSPDQILRAEAQFRIWSHTHWTLPPSRAQRRSWERTSPHSALWHALDYFNDVLVANYHACGFMTLDEFINHIQDVCAFINPFAAPFNELQLKSA